LKLIELAVPDNNGVGVVSYMLCGGRHSLLTTLGYACDSLLSARIVTAAGDLLDVSATSYPDLFWGLKGAGTFYGVVTSLTMKTYPFSTLGNSEGTVYHAMYVFPLERIDEVSAAMETIMNDTTHHTEGHLMLVCPPPAHKPAIVVSGHYFGSSEIGPRAFESVAKLGPTVDHSGPLPFVNWYDALDFVNQRGAFKRFRPAGGPQFSAAKFRKLRDLYIELVSTIPDAGRSGIFFKWFSLANKIPTTDTSLLPDQHYQFL
jgi:hypothetical protein